ncbi:hypothetical protein DH86_00001531 [Scytalidium sp. 3C]|nr:hypothetical protein DH86_00001531 [Scytalidium sp. 3C]
MSAPSFTSFVVKRPWLKNALTPLSNWYCNAAGYRKLGLRQDDLIPEESDLVLQALKRLPPKEAYDRVFRLRRAFQDYPYLSPIIKELEAEAKERHELDTLVVKRK